MWKINNVNNYVCFKEINVYNQLLHETEDCKITYNKV